MQEFFLSGLISAGLIVFTCLLVYECLRIIWGILPRLTIPHRMRILVVISGVFAVHIVNIWIYAIAYYLLIHFTDIGSLVSGTITGNHRALDFWGYLYFSAITYSTVGFGDVTPVGGLRMLAGAEALNGIVVIGWTVSFTYLAMERFWTGTHKNG
jgi:uncharacterized membrane protein YgdD (TMEM256/DUF423 family)